MSAGERRAAREGLTAQLTALVSGRGARSVTCYLPRTDEPDTTGFLEWAERHDVEVLLPVARADGSLDWAIHGTDAPVPGRHGVPEPPGTRLPGSAAERAELLLIPACSVDARGTRLGWGLGYYDRTLAGLDPLPPVFAIVFEADLVDALPREPHDVPVTGVVTPERTVRFDRAA